MPLLSETTKRQHRIGQPIQTTIQNHYMYDLQDASKDLLRETARRENMNNYSNASVPEIRDYLQGRNVSNIVFRVIKRQE